MKKKENRVDLKFCYDKYLFGFTLFALSTIENGRMCVCMHLQNDENTNEILCTEEKERVYCVVCVCVRSLKCNFH